MSTCDIEDVEVLFAATSATRITFSLAVCKAKHEMELNRNHYFMVGLVVLFLGIQIKCVEAYVLTEDAAQVVAKRLGKKETPGQSVARPLMFAATGANPTLSARSLEPPTWLGWALISIGAVLVLHSLAMNKPGGG